jgi:hypothetical protein
MRSSKSTHYISAERLLRWMIPGTRKYVLAHALALVRKTPVCVFSSFYVKGVFIMRNLIVNHLAVSFARITMLRDTHRQNSGCKLIVLSLVMAGLLAITGRSQAALIPTVIYQQDFNAGLPVGQMTAYGNVSVTSASNAAQLSSNGQLAYLTNDNFVGETYTVEADVNQLNGAAGGTVSGIVVGNRAFTIFPGFPGGAFNVYNFNPLTGTLAGLILGDTNMGFTPAQGSYHHYKVDVDPFTGNVDVRIYQNGNLLSTPFLYQQVGDMSFAPSRIGFFNFSSPHDTLYDNLTVTALRPEPAPEPSSFLLLGFGLVGLSLRRKTRRG